MNNHLTNISHLFVFLISISVCECQQRMLCIGLLHCLSTWQHGCACLQHDQGLHVLGENNYLMQAFYTCYLLLFSLVCPTFCPQHNHSPSGTSKQMSYSIRMLPGNRHSTCHPCSSHYKLDYLTFLCYKKYNYKLRIKNYECS